MTKLLVDNKEIEIEPGTVLLEACLRNHIYIPNLCYLPGMPHPDASCRLCFVEIDGKVVPSCTVKVNGPMRVKTDTPAVRKLQQSALRLLLSVHEVDCANCPANKQCALQEIARFLRVGLKPKGLDRLLKEPSIVSDHPFIDFYPNRCVLCGRCVRLCRTKEGRPQMNFSARGFNTVISFYGANRESMPTCEECRSCLKACPVGALVLREPARE
ncbi:MAG: (2Fe-2S)-binding protein [Deltaproteobacteria bacterium]|nr:(2Fe-2S)-binding protein [Deltaproteobacteria bacterium]